MLEAILNVLMEILKIKKKKKSNTGILNFKNVTKISVEIRLNRITLKVIFVLLFFIF